MSEFPRRAAQLRVASSDVRQALLDGEGCFDMVATRDIPAGTEVRRPPPQQGRRGGPPGDRGVLRETRTEGRAFTDQTTTVVRTMGPREERLG